MLIDSHAHLNLPRFEGDLEEVLKRAADAGVGEILNISIDSSTIDETVALADNYEMIRGTVGIHPHEAKTWTPEIEEKIKKLLLRRKILGVGETGLDYYRDLSGREDQRMVFKKQIAIAVYFKKPIVIHSREAFDDVIDILRREGGREIGGVMHAFSGGEKRLKEIIDMGFLVGIGGPVTYRNSRLPEAVSRLPSNAFLLETDCPYLPPEPYRGKRNEPSYVRLVARKMADLMGVDTEDIERASEVNYRRLFYGDQHIPPAVAYILKGNLYINVTNYCVNNCSFCAYGRRDKFLYGYNLKLEEEPSVEEMVSETRKEAERRDVSEVVFCGYGEPSTRIGEILETAVQLKSLGVPLRLNTNGQGNLIHGRNIVPQLESVFDRISISMNAENEDKYVRVCRPNRGREAYRSVMDFIRKSAVSSMECTVTAVDYGDVDIEACRKVVEGMEGAEFKMRKYKYPLSESVISWAKR